MKNMAKELKEITKQLEALSRRTNALTKAVGKGSSPAVKRGRKVAVKAKAKAKAKAASAKKSRTSLTTDNAIQIIKRYKKGIDVATLKKKTGYDDKKISNIVHRAFKKGIITRVGRGLYKAV